MRKLFVTLLLTLLPLSVWAQVTTASIAGTVTDSHNNAIVGATVVAVNRATGVTYGTSANVDGKYHLDGLKVGGEYVVTFSCVGYITSEIDKIYPVLGQTVELNTLLKDQPSIDSVVVVGDYKPYSNFSSHEIEAMPTVSRSIYDIARLSPYAATQQEGGVAIGGANSRYNSFYIDGIVNNDMYGLTASGTNGGLASANPIPLDALEQVQIVTAPFDVRQSGFTGGGINAVTKSGTNTSTATAYAYYSDNNFYGKGANNTPLSKQNTFTYGASMGGAFVKNKLFYFINAENSTNLSPSAYHIGDPNCNVAEKDAITIAEHYKSLTGYDGGGYGSRNIERRSTSILARIDWSISDKHNLAVRYNFLDAGKDEYVNSASTLLFHGSGYTSVSTTHSVMAELDSRVSSSVFNSLRVGYTRVTDGRDTDTKTPFVTIDHIREGEKTAVKIGTDGMACSNSLAQNSITLSDYLSINKGSHNITVGTHNEIFTAKVLFVSNANGSYTYSTMDDFLNSKPSMFQQTIPVGDASTRINTAQFGLFAQDEVRINSLYLTYGLRADMPVIFNTPRENSAFNSHEIALQYGVQTNSKPKSHILLSPRVGFKWYALKESNIALTLRGGAGIFTGRIPFVWITNCYSNTGMTQMGYTLYGDNIPAFGVSPSGTAGTSANPVIYVADRKFRMPQTFKANLALETTVRGWKVSVEGIYAKSINDISIRNIVAADNGSKLYAVGGNLANENNTTPYYDTSAKKSFSSIYLLENESRGYSYNLSAMVEKNFVFGLQLAASYTFSQSFTVNDGVSSSAPSIWGKSYATVSNNKSLTHSVFEVPHKLTVQLSYSKRYGVLFGTTVSLIYQGYSGMRYTPTYYKNGVDVNGDTYRGNTTIYIPTEAELAAMTFESADQRVAFNEYIMQHRALRDNRGKYAERNCLVAPFEHHVDLHFAQDFYFSKHNSRKVQITLDIMNLTNALNKNWGAVYFLDDWKLSPVEVTALTDDGKGNKTPSYRFVGGEISKNDLLSRWSMQLGLRVVF
ncbi:MAG: TonB-dependent receptor [Alistipes sp.]|nr:TonB-dependent receptor [Alistipes sp.]